MMDRTGGGVFRFRFGRFKGFKGGVIRCQRQSANFDVCQ